MNYYEYLKSAKERRDEVVRLATESNPPLSYREIGLLIEPNITGQRVGHILKSAKLSRRSLTPKHATP